MTLLVWTLALSTLAFDAPEGWNKVESSSGMRLAHWELPGDEALLAEAVIFYFGEGQGGSVEANLERWFGQFVQEDGSSSRDKAELSEREAGGLSLTVVDIEGVYVASVRPGASERYRRPNYRMIAAVIEGDGGPWFLRVIGPKSTVSKWEASVQDFLSSLRLESP